MNLLSKTALLDPKGIIALHESDLIVTATYLMLLVVVPVFILTAVIAWRYRATNIRAKYLPNWEHNKLEEFIWWAVPCIIITIIAHMTWTSSHALDPFRPIESSTPAITVQVVALNWKWLFIYPDLSIATVNTLTIPQDVPIHFEITADAPMNSFWIPDLGGQIYAMPGMKSQLYLMASHSGTYPGLSANFSGEGFAGMQFQTHVVTMEEFNTWVQTAANSRETLDAATYATLVRPTSNEPIRLFRHANATLFHDIVMKYMSPATMQRDMDMHHE